MHVLHATWLVEAYACMWTRPNVTRHQLTSTVIVGSSTAHASVGRVGQRGQSAFICLYDLLRDTSCRTECFDIDVKLAVLDSHNDRTERLLFYFSWVYNYKYSLIPDTETEATLPLQVYMAVATTPVIVVPPRTTRGNSYPHRSTPAVLHQPSSLTTMCAVADARPNHTAAILPSTMPGEFVVHFHLLLLACCCCCCCCCCRYFLVIIITLEYPTHALIFIIIFIDKNCDHFILSCISRTSKTAKRHFISRKVSVSIYI